VGVVRYFAGARAAAGIPEEPVEVSAGTTVHDLLEQLTARHGQALAKVLSASSFLLDGVAVRDRDVTLHDAFVLDVLPPFAGG
jgi:molybdopterin converting factor small subunit